MVNADERGPVNYHGIGPIFQPGSHDLLGFYSGSITQLVCAKVWTTASQQRMYSPLKAREIFGGRMHS
jgi:hypothetical protein